MEGIIIPKPFFQFLGIKEKVEVWPCQFFDELLGPHLSLSLCKYLLCKTFSVKARGVNLFVQNHLLHISLADPLWCIYVNLSFLLGALVSLLIIRAAATAAAIAAHLLLPGFALLETGKFPLEINFEGFCHRSFQLRVLCHHVDRKVAQLLEDKLQFFIVLRDVFVAHWVNELTQESSFRLLRPRTPEKTDYPHFQLGGVMTPVFLPDRVVLAFDRAGNHKFLEHERP